MAEKRIAEVTVQVTSPDREQLRKGKLGVEGISVLILLTLEGEEATEGRFYNLAGDRCGDPVHIIIHTASRDRVALWAAGLDCEKPEAVVEADRASPQRHPGCHIITPLPNRRPLTHQGSAALLLHVEIDRPQAVAVVNSYILGHATLTTLG